MANVLGALAPGMNQLARVAVRSGLDRGYQMKAVRGGVPGLINGDVVDVSWADVEGMANTGGDAFGTRRMSGLPSTNGKKPDCATVDGWLLKRRRLVPFAKSTTISPFGPVSDESVM